MSKGIKDKVKEIVDQPEIEELPPIKGWLSTGCTLLDLAITNKLPGGIACGRITHIYGAESTAKSVLAATLLGSAQRDEMVGVYADVENTFDPVFSRFYGLDSNDKDTFRLRYPRTIEELFDETIKEVIELKEKRPRLFVVDSLTAMPSEVETNAEMKDSTYGVTRAKQMGAGLRKYIRPIAENNVTLVFIDQTRDNIAMFGPKEVVSGGRGLKFYSSTRIYLQSDIKVENALGKITGIWVKFQISKNKVSVPFREGRFKILFDYGIDDIESNLYFIKEDQVGIKDAKKKSVSFSFNGETKKMSSMIRYVEDNDLEDVLQNKVVNLWNEIYAPTKRKQRSWS